MRQLEHQEGVTKEDVDEYKKAALIIKSVNDVK